MEQLTIESDINKRLDVYISELKGFSRSKTSKMIKDGFVLVNNKKSKNSYLLKENDIVIINDYVENMMSSEPENIPLNIVYEDDDVIVINKANGMVVHPAIGNSSGTLVNALLYHSKNLSKINGDFRPGIVHRIDAYTTGLLIVAKNDKAHDILASQLQKKQIRRDYIALVWGVINEDTGTIDAPIGRDSKDRKKMNVTSVNSKNAVTHFKVVERYKEATLIKLSLETGRTHQIRVHMNYINHPIVNDPVYGKRKIIDNSGQCLHAYKIGFIHPTLNKYMEFECKTPDCFNNVLNQFKKGN